MFLEYQAAVPEKLNTKRFARRDDIRLAHQGLCRATCQCRPVAPRSVGDGVQWSPHIGNASEHSIHVGFGTLKNGQVIIAPTCTHAVDVFADRVAVCAQIGVALSRPRHRENHGARRQHVIDGGEVATVHRLGREGREEACLMIVAYTPFNISSPFSEGRKENASNRILSSALQEMLCLVDKKSWFVKRNEKDDS